MVWIVECFFLYVTILITYAFYTAKDYYSQEHRNEVKAQLPVGSHSSVVVSITFLAIVIIYI